MTIVSYLAWSGLVMAQGEPDENCPLCITWKDATCSAIFNCLSVSNCESVTFGVPCSKNYNIKAWTECSGQACDRCQSCVNVFNGVTQVGHCHVTNCDSGSCDYSCTPIYLQVCVYYTLYVCKGYCLTNGSCDDCGSTCQAYGAVYNPEGCSP